MFFRKKKINLKRAYEKIGLFKIIRVTGAGHQFAVPLKEVVTYYNGKQIKRPEPLTNELLDEIIRKEIPFKVIEWTPEEYEKTPPHRIIWGRLEFPRLGLIEE